MPTADRPQPPRSERFRARAAGHGDAPGPGAQRALSRRIGLRDTGRCPGENPSGGTTRPWVRSQTRGRELMAELPARNTARADAVSSFVTRVPAHPDDNPEQGTGTSPAAHADTHGSRTRRGREQVRPDPTQPLSALSRIKTGEKQRQGTEQKAQPMKLKPIA